MTEFVLPGLTLLLITVFVIVRELKRRDEDFRYLIEPLLLKHQLKFQSSRTPGILEKTPFNKFSIRPKVLFLNSGSTDARLHQRLVCALNKNGKLVKIWAQIEEHPLKETQIEFEPELEDIE